MLFQPFQPSLMRVEKVEQPNQPKTVFYQKNTKQLNEPNQPETVDPNRTRPKPPTQTFFELLAQFSRGERLRDEPKECLLGMLAIQLLMKIICNNYKGDGKLSKVS